MPYYIDDVYRCIGNGGVPFNRRIQITQAAWNGADPVVQEGVNHILENQPIRILSGNEHGNGIKIEQQGLEFHTKTLRRIQAPEIVTENNPWTFSNYGRGYGH